MRLDTKESTPMLEIAGGIVLAVFVLIMAGELWQRRAERKRHDIAAREFAERMRRWS
jgi:hypothetical protein